MNEIYADSDSDLVKFLKEKYPHILKSIQKEDYLLEFVEFSRFQEIYWEDEVVGFITFNQFHIIPTDIAINECYIIPDFRGNNLLFNELFNLITTPNLTFYPRNPNKAFIKVLLKNDLAFKFSNNLIISYMKFVVDLDTVYKNPKIKRFYKTPEIEDIPYKANIFDMELCSILFLDPILNFIKYTDVMALTLPRKSDLKKYKLRKKLKRVNESYLDNCYETREYCDDKILDYFDKIDHEIEDLISVEKNLGTSKELTSDFIEYLEENNLSKEDGFKIIEHINTNLENDELTIINCKRRMQYLVENIGSLNNVLDENSFNCPFCGAENLVFVESCETCGQKLRDMSFEEKLQEFQETFDIEELLENLQSDENLGKVKIEENDPLYELKTYYNEKLVGLDFEEISEYYENADKTKNILDIIEDYFNFKIIENEDFDIYLNYLIGNYYDYLDNKKFNDALTFFIQTVILALNSDIVHEGNAFERTHYSMDILYMLEQFEEYGGKYDLDNCLEKAFKTFKVEKWNNNKDEIYEIMYEYF